MLFTAGVHGGGADMRDGLDGDAVLFKTETASGQDFFVRAGVQVCETVGELDILAIGRNRAEGTFTLCVFMVW